MWIYVSYIITYDSQIHISAYAVCHTSYLLYRSYVWFFEHIPESLDISYFLYLLTFILYIFVLNNVYVQKYVYILTTCRLGFAEVNIGNIV